MITKNRLTIIIAGVLILLGIGIYNLKNEKFNIQSNKIENAEVNPESDFPILKAHPSAAIMPDFTAANLPADVYTDQITMVIKSNNELFAMASQPNMNYALETLQDKTIKWHGVLRSADNGKSWSRFFTIDDPKAPDESYGTEQIKFNPISVFREGQSIFVDIADSHGAGSGEGRMVRFESTDNGVTWQRRGCLDFIPERYYIGYREGIEWTGIDPYQLEKSDSCMY